MEIRNIDQLIREYYRKHPTWHYFDRETLKWFGERISDMRLLKDKAVITADDGTKHTCYVVSKLQRKHPKGPRRVYTYFDVDTLTRIYGERTC